jgi:hypothetical protein
MSWSLLCSESSVRIIDDCLFCRCRGLSCVQRVKMIYEWQNSMNTRKTTIFTKQTIIYHPYSLNTRNTATSTKQTVIYHPKRIPWTQEWPRHLQNEHSYRCRGVSCVLGVRMIDDCSFCRCRSLSCVQGVLLRWYMIVCFVDVKNSLNTRKTTTSTKRTIIYHPNRTPWTQERPGHQQNEQSSIILTPWTQERPRHLQNQQSSIILTLWTQETPRHLREFC